MTCDRLRVYDCALRQVDKTDYSTPGTQNDGSNSRVSGDGAVHSNRPGAVGITGVEDEPPGMTPDPNIIPNVVEEESGGSTSDPEDIIPNVLPSGD